LSFSWIFELSIWGAFFKKIIKSFYRALKKAQKHSTSPLLKALSSNISVVRIDKFLSVKTLVGFEIFVDFVRFVEQFFVGFISLRS
jgi:hypothetical protein